MYLQMTLQSRTLLSSSLVEMIAGRMVAQAHTMVV